MRFWIAAVGIVCVVAQAQAQAQEREPLHFSKLIEYLPGPDSIAGFTAAKPKGSTTSGMGMKVTVVSVDLAAQSDPQQTIQVQITDGAPTQYATIAYSMLGKFSKETTEGYEKAVEIDGFKAIEKYEYASKQGTLTAVVHTLLVQIDTRGLPPETLQSTFKVLQPQSLPKPGPPPAVTP